MINVIDVTNPRGEVIAAEWLLRALTVHQQLRPHLRESDYRAVLSEIFANGGRMCIAREDSGVRGLAVWRLLRKTHDGLTLYVDDLVTDDASRSRGIGSALVQHLENIAVESGCVSLSLDSGTQRTGAHKFYFREGFVVTSFHFVKKLA